MIFSLAYETYPGTRNVPGYYPGSTGYIHLCTIGWDGGWLLYRGDRAAAALVRTGAFPTLGDLCSTAIAFQTHRSREAYTDRQRIRCVDIVLGTAYACNPHTPRWRTALSLEYPGTSRKLRKKSYVFTLFEVSNIF